MNWDAVAAVSEAIGAAGVIATLAYLANQIRLSRMTALSGSIDLLSDGWNRINTQLLDGQTAEVMIQGWADVDALSPADRYRFVCAAQSYVNHFMTIKRRYDAGLLPPAEWETHARGFTALFDNPGGEWILANVAVTPDVLDVVREHKGRPDGPNYGFDFPHPSARG